MGYTHYWYRNTTLDAAKFAAAVADCKKVCAALPIPLGDGCGEGEPVFDTNLVALNGHVTSGSMMPQVARVDGLLWPSRKAEGVAGWSSTEPPVAGMWFAGAKVSARTLPESGDGSYESFVIEQTWDGSHAIKGDDGKHFDCCKTNMRPYDLCVQCCLVVFKEHFGDAVKVRSDGDSEDWNEARDVCQHVLGYGLLFALDAE